MTHGLVAIVKDEAENVERLVDSVYSLVSSVTVVDTGSTDDTIAALAGRGIKTHHRFFSGASGWYRLYRANVYPSPSFFTG